MLSHVRPLNNSLSIFAIAIITSSLWNTTVLRGDDLVESSTQLDSPAADWAMDSTTGRVFCATDGGEEILEFNSNGKEVGRIKVGKGTSKLLIKRDKLVVATTGDSSLRVIGLAMNREVGKVQLFGKGPYALFCSQVDNNLVYAICNTGDAWWDGEIFQVDISKLTIRKRVKVQGWGQSHPLHVAMSKDGKWIVPDARGASSPSGADLMKVNEEECTFTQVRDYHDSFGQITAGPFNRYWSFGKDIYSLDIKRKVRSFTGSPIAIHPKYDLVASVSNNGLHLERFSDASSITTTKLTDSDKANDRSVKNRSRSFSKLDFNCSFDLKNDRVFVGLKNSGHWFDLSGVKEKLTPLKLLHLPSEIESRVGLATKIPIKVTNAELDPETEVQIANEDKSVSLVGGNLIVNPTAEDVGISVLKLNLVSKTNKKVLDSIETTLSITLPKVEFDFFAKSMSVSKSGKYAVVWGLAKKNEDRHPAHTGADEMAVVDLVNKKVIKQRTLPQGLRAAEIDDKYVYFSPKSGNLFYRSNHLLEENKRQFVQFAPLILKRDTKDLLTISGERGETNHYNVNTLKEVVDAKTNSAAKYLSPFSISSSRNQALASLPALNEYRVFSNNRSIPTSRYGSKVQASWGRHINNGSLTNSTGNQIKRWPGQRQGFISEKWPMAVLIGTASNNQARTVTQTLELCDLVDGSVKHTAIINVKPSSRRSPSFYGARNTLIESGNDVLVLDGKTLLMAPIPQDIAKKMPVPVHFSQTQVDEIEMGKSKTIELEVVGKKEGNTYSLAHETSTVNIAEETGEISVDLDALWETLTSSIQVYSNNSKTFRVSSSRSSTREHTFENIAATYKAATGKVLPKDKMAAKLFISARLTDPAGQSDTTNFTVIVVGPRKPIQDRIDTRVAEINKQMEERKQAQIARAKEMERRKLEGENKEGGDGSDLGKRMDQLENRMRRIEAAMDAILRKLEEKK